MQFCATKTSDKDFFTFFPYFSNKKYYVRIQINKMQIITEHFLAEKQAKDTLLLLKLFFKFFVGFHYICEENYLYDAENQYCDLPERVNCEWR